MFDIGFFELVTVAVVALLVLGPERLPHAARMTGAAFGKLRRLMAGFKADLQREIELEDLKKRLQNNRIEEISPLDQLKNLRQELESLREFNQPSNQAIEPPAQKNESNDDQPKH